ncbi:MAG: hypothetical protein P4N41_18175 [Negativicutes bacterium]|nr:hypothetical protein [Negativicutes bacterium]
MNIMFGRSIFGRYIFSGITKSAAVVTVTFPEIDNTFYIAIQNAVGQVTGYLSSDIFNSPATSVDFELTTNGCGQFTITCDRAAADILANNQRISIYLFGSLVPWYTGYVLKRPKPGGTQESLQFTGYGFFQKLDKIIINKTYVSTEVSAAVTDLVQNVIAPITGIRYNSNKMYPTDYTLQKLRFDYVKAKDAMQTLSEYGIDYVYGVDELMEFFFKPRITTINEDTRFWVGHHCQSFVPDEDPSTVVNFFYVKYGNLNSNGTNYYVDGSGNPIPFYDSDSIDTYGQMEDVLDLPNAITGDDITRWAQNQLDQLKTPSQTAKIDGISLDVIKRNIRPEGMSAITAIDGTIYEYPVTNIKYSLSADKGIAMAMTLGDLPPRIDRYIAKILKDADMADALQQLNNQQLSGVDI